MIDRDGRDIAASLMRRFRDCEIANEDMIDKWPKSHENDYILIALYQELYFFYEGTDDKLLTGELSFTPDDHELLTRYLLFVESDHPYEWPEGQLNPLNFGRLIWCFIVFGISFSLLGFKISYLAAFLCFSIVLFMAYWFEKWNDRSVAKYNSFMNEMKKAGDFDVWPFFKKTDYEAAKLAYDL